MSNARHVVILNLFKVLDVVTMVGAFAVATIPLLYEGRGVSLHDFLSMRVKVQNFLLFLGLMLAWHVIFKAVGLYHSHRLDVVHNSIPDALKAAFVGTLFLGLVGTIIHIRMVDPLFLGVFWLASSVLVVLTRSAIRFYRIRARRLKRNLRHVLIVGTNVRAVELARRIEAQPDSPYRVIGFADDEWAGSQTFRETGYSQVSSLRDLAPFFRSSAIDEVVMALPLKSFYFQASRIAALCEEQGIVMSLLPSLFNLRVARSKAEDFEGESVVTLYSGQLVGGPAAVKRALDFILSLALLILLAPLFLLTALLIKLTSPGPVLFDQERLGLNKHRFRIYKFRTMIPNAEQVQVEIECLNEVSGPVFKIKNDPRITPLGRLLRKLSIDELPQLFNVLKGDMSLVGPRPLPVRDYEGFDQDWHRRRFSVRPGITCLWQVKGRSSIPFEQWMELDMQYIDQWSLWLDLKILVDTIPAVLKGSGAA